MNDVLTIVVSTLCFGVFECIWRRWFGGGFDYRWLRWLNFRFVKHVLNIGFIFGVCTLYRGLEWTWSLYFTLVMQLVFWATSFGMYFDIGRGGKPTTQEQIDEYNKPWFSPIINWFFHDEQRYTPFYDYCAMAFRFSYPLAILFFVPSFNFGLLVLGELVALYYGLGWVCYEKWLIKKMGPTEFGEYASGFTTGVFLGLCGLI